MATAGFFESRPSGPSLPLVWVTQPTGASTILEGHTYEGGAERLMGEGVDVKARSDVANGGKGNKSILHVEEKLD